ncbi:Formamidopyrimidine-DNA glycosylase [Planctomycetes bacterium Pla163]|uniref:DNA-(apurinic or apyrimidinic site) lyase n=1 Tax=Rohdeia mirabilis TaxID=2528008 RepID=A0A518CVL0_9BACT|nr:Formamidopyrimidine-DNA glycosylase [Planctomycetes bacterium Pla163]
MPEGDTIHTLAGALRPELVGERLVGGRVHGHADLRLDGRRVEGLDVHGKHLFVRLSARGDEPGHRDAGRVDAGSGAARHGAAERGGPQLNDARIDGPLVVQSHLGLHGAWHRYRPGETFAAGRALGPGTIVLETARRVYVCFRPKEVAVFDGDDAGRLVRARQLGPDLVTGAPTATDLAPRIARFVGSDAPLVDLLLDQRVACGIGNVYASELLFDRRLHPLEPVASLAAARLADLYRRAHQLLAANVGAGPRVTRGERDGRGHLAVYGRAGQPCLVCGTPIEAAHIGRGRRITSWCPTCQVRGSANRGTISSS